MFFIIHGEMLFNKISWWDDISGVLGGVPVLIKDETEKHYRPCFCWIRGAYAFTLRSE